MVRVSKLKDSWRDIKEKPTDPPDPSNAYNYKKGSPLKFIKLAKEAEDKNKLKYNELLKERSKYLDLVDQFKDKTDAKGIYIFNDKKYYFSALERKLEIIKIDMENILTLITSRTEADVANGFEVLIEQKIRC